DRRIGPTRPRDAVVLGERVAAGERDDELVAAVLLAARTVDLEGARVIAQLRARRQQGRVENRDVEHRPAALGQRLLEPNRVLLGGAGDVDHRRFGRGLRLAATLAALAALAAPVLGAAPVATGPGAGGARDAEE